MWALIFHLLKLLYLPFLVFKTTSIMSNDENFHCSAQQWSSVQDVNEGHYDLLHFDYVVQ